jgi:hypothetical protein
VIILIIGSKGSGKSTIAGALADRVNGIHLNENYLMQTVNQDLSGFQDGQEAARRAGELSRMLSNIQEKPVIVDIELGTRDSRKAFGPADITVWMDTVNTEGTPFEDPNLFDHKIENTGDEYLDSIPTRTFKIITTFNLFDWKPEQHIMIGHFQPWTKEHLEAYEDISSKNKKVVIGVLHSGGMTEDTPLRYEEVKELILSDLPSARIIKLPNMSILSPEDV